MKKPSFSKIKKLKGIKLLKVLGVIALALIIISFILMLVFRKIDNKKVSNKKTTFKSVKIAPNMLWLSEEPLPLPPIQFSRNQKKIWSEEDIQQFYEAPNKKTIEELHKKNEQIIKNLLEEVE